MCEGEADTELIGPELTCGIAYCVTRASASWWVSSKHQKNWGNTDGQMWAKRVLRGPILSARADSLNVKRKNIHKMTGFKT